jgi:hypothetical protein
LVKINTIPKPKEISSKRNTKRPILKNTIKERNSTNVRHFGPAKLSSLPLIEEFSREEVTVIPAEEERGRSHS